MRAMITPRALMRLLKARQYQRRVRAVDSKLEALVLRHEQTTDEWAVEILQPGQAIEYVPISKLLKRGIMDQFYRTKIQKGPLKLPANERNDLKTLLAAAVDRAEATHKRAREVISRWDETERKVAAVSKKTQEMLQRQSRR